MTAWKEIKTKNCPTIIWGAGFLGKTLKEQAKTHDIDVLAFIDNAAGKQKNELLGVPILSLKDAYETFPSAIFLISVRDIETIAEQIKKEAPSLIYYLIDELYEREEIENPPQNWGFFERNKLEAAYFYHLYFHSPEKIYFRTLDFVITERCSLKCKECSNLMQFYEQPKNYPLAELKEDLTNLLSIADEIYELRLIGGEPFMHKQMKELIAFLNQEPKIRHISIYTNATILPPEELLFLMKEGKKTWFSISDYGKLSRNLRALLSRLDAHGIGYEHKSIDYWTHCASFKHRKRSLEERKRVYYECCAKDLLTYIKGKLCACPFIANGINLNAIPAFAGDYVDLRRKDLRSNVIRDEIAKKFRNRPFFASCNFCTGRPAVPFIKEEDKIAPHEQVASPLPYKKYKISDL